MHWSLITHFQSAQELSQFTLEAAAIFHPFESRRFLLAGVSGRGFRAIHA